MMLKMIRTHFCLCSFTVMLPRSLWLVLVPLEPGMVRNYHCRPIINETLQCSSGAHTLTGLMSYFVLLFFTSILKTQKAHSTQMKCNHPQCLCAVQMMIQMMGIFFSTFIFASFCLAAVSYSNADPPAAATPSASVLATLFTIINNAQKNLIFALI